MFLASLVLILLAAQPTPSPPARATPPHSGVSWDLADSLTRKLAALQKRANEATKPGPSAPETVIVTQAELNSYLNLTAAGQMPSGVTDVELLLERDRVAAKALVDLEQVKARMPPPSAFSPMNLLSGRLPVELRGRLRNQDGFGTFELEEVRLGPVMLPPSVVGQFVATATRTSQNPRGFDILAPFRLPYSLRRVRLQPGRALLDF